jgi:hypothetical protein
MELWISDAPLSAQRRRGPLASTEASRDERRGGCRIAEEAHRHLSAVIAVRGGLGDVRALRVELARVARGRPQHAETTDGDDEEEGAPRIHDCSKCILKPCRFKPCSSTQAASW